MQLAKYSAIKALNYMEGLELVNLFILLFTENIRLNQFTRGNQALQHYRTSTKMNCRTKATYK